MIAAAPTLAAALLLFLAGAVPATVQAEPAVPPRVYQQTVHAAAWVRGVKNGTGWLLNRERKLLVTCCHIVGKEKRVQVFFPDYLHDNLVTERDHYEKKVAPVTGQVLVRDAQRDLAVIELASVPPGITALPLAADNPAPGERLHALGNADASPGLWGYASGVVRQVCRKKETHHGALLDACVVVSQLPIHPGDSGGPVVNDAGELVAVASGRMDKARLVTFGIAVSELRQTASQLDGALPDGARPRPKGEQAGAAASARDVYRKLLPATVWISRSPKETGTGCLVDPARKLVLTARHVIGNEESVKVWFPAHEDGKLIGQREFYLHKATPIRARLLCREPKCGLAVLELESLPEKVTALKLAAASAEPGAPTYALGNPVYATGLWVFQAGTVRQVYHFQGPRPGGTWDGRGP
jgi:S1-C subfamily serine protease